MKKSLKHENNVSYTEEEYEKVEYRFKQLVQKAAEIRLENYSFDKIKTDRIDKQETVIDKICEISVLLYKMGEIVKHCDECLREYKSLNENKKLLVIGLAQNNTPAFHQLPDEIIKKRTFLESQAELLLDLKTALKQDYSNQEDVKKTEIQRIHWTQTEPQIIAFFDLLEETGIISGFKKDGDCQWSLIATHFENKNHGEFKPKQLSSVFQRESNKNLEAHKKAIIQRMNIF